MATRRPGSSQSSTIVGTGLCVGQLSFFFEINNLKEERTALTPGFSIFGPWLLGSVTSGPEVKKNIFF